MSFVVTVAFVIAFVVVVVVSFIVIIVGILWLLISSAAVFPDFFFLTPIAGDDVIAVAVWNSALVK